MNLEFKTGFNTATILIKERYKSQIIEFTLIITNLVNMHFWCLSARHKQIFILLYLSILAQSSILSPSSKLSTYDTLSKVDSVRERDKLPVLVLDIDGTLYEDNCGIEEQIRDNCFLFGKRVANLSHDECQAMHIEKGSTIRGLAGTN